MAAVMPVSIASPVARLDRLAGELGAIDPQMIDRDHVYMHDVDDDLAPRGDERREALPDRLEAGVDGVGRLEELRGGRLDEHGIAAVDGRVGGRERPVERDEFWHRVRREAVIADGVARQGAGVIERPVPQLAWGPEPVVARRARGRRAGNGA
jgi:hypothetical protein